jgi:hypothetical protein
MYHLPQAFSEFFIGMLAARLTAVLAGQCIDLWFEYDLGACAQFVFRVIPPQLVTYLTPELVVGYLCFSRVLSE